MTLSRTGTLGFLLLSCHAALANTVGTVSGAFSVSPSGSASYTIPITAPPGAGGIEPQLSIQFDSESGDGFMGPRFSIGGLSQISRCPATAAQDGAYVPVDLTTSDRFCLDGQRLVANNYSAFNTEYRTEIESFSRVTLRGSPGVPSYWTVETKSGLTMTYGGMSGSNLCTQPGAARVTHSVQNNRAFAWWLSRVEDSAGNWMEFCYRHDSASNETLPETVHYTGNLRNGQQPFARVEFNYRPHTGVPPETWFLGMRQRRTQTLASVATHVASQAGAVRTYSFDYEVQGAAQREYLTSVQECAGSTCLPPTRFDWESFSEGIGSPQSYTYGNLGDGYEQFVGDWNADGLQDFLALRLQGNTATAQVFRGQIGGGQPERKPKTVDSDVPGGAGTWHKVAGDFDGDGRTDLALVRNYYSYTDSSFFRDHSEYINAYVYLSRDSGTFTPRRASDLHNNWTEEIEPEPCYPWEPDCTDPRSVPDDESAVDAVDRQADDFGFDFSTVNGISSTADGVGTASAGSSGPITIALPTEKFVGDLNGNGRDDILLVHVSRANGIRVQALISNGDGTFEFQSPRYQSSLPADGYRAQLVDLNGNGLMDLAVTQQSGSTINVRTFRNHGDGSFSLAFAGALQAEDPYGARDHVVMDVNGDGNVDIVAVTTLQAEVTFDVFLGRGHGEFSPAVSSRFQSDLPPLSRSNHRFGGHARGLDVNGDGLPDLVLLNYGSINTVVWTYISQPNGRLIQGPPRWTVAGSGHQVHQADMRGDGKGGLVALRIGSNTELQVVHADSGLPGWVSRITNGLGSTIDITYKPLTDTSAYTATGACGGASFHRMCGPMRVVVETLVSNGTFAPRRVTYHYEDLRVDRSGRGFLGPSRQTVTDVATGGREVTTYRQDFPYIGQPSVAEVYAGDALVSRANFTYNQRVSFQASPNAVFPFAGTITERRYELPPFASGALFVTTVTTNTLGEPDGGFFGNVTESEVRIHGGDTGAPSFSTTTENQYDNNTDLWHLGRLRRTKVTRTGHGMDPKSRTSAFEYHPETGLLTAEIIEPDSPALWLRTNYLYDLYGNVLEKEISGAGIDPRTVRTEYFATAPNYGRFNNRTTGPLEWGAQAHLTQQTYDARHGAVTSQTDANGLATTFQHDVWGRLTQERFNQHGINRTKTVQRGWCTAEPATCGTPQGAIFVRTTDSTGEASVRVLDGLEREIRRTSRNGEGRWVEVITEYDSRGRVGRTSSPRFTGASTTYWTTYQYDSLGRVLSETAADGGVTTYQYDGLIQKQTNAAG